MSQVYVNEPPTLGKICLETSVGEIEIELFSRECPKTVRNFVQLCMEGYYERTKFHRVVRDFIVQGGDPTGTGQGKAEVNEETVNPLNSVFVVDPYSHTMLPRILK